MSNHSIEIGQLVLVKNLAEYDDRWVTVTGFDGEKLVGTAVINRNDRDAWGEPKQTIVTFPTTWIVMVLPLKKKA